MSDPIINADIAAIKSHNKQRIADADMITQLREDKRELVDGLELCRKRLSHAAYCAGVGETQGKEAEAKVYAKEVKCINGKLDALIAKHGEGT